ncbi:flagellar hook-associated protein FlgK [Deltaproteobacteria bacterium OttesenSCG-928-M10]|nr:flagellar hook-associated protein FlgK [Deltaproteobacteria bacterium OttesenSCG-928-M10]
MGVTSSLYVALSGMNLSQAGMEVASHNIANVNTPGYSRQRINLETTPTWRNASYGQMGTGVTAQNITRFHDEFLTRSIITKSSQYGNLAAQKSAVDSLESFFNESDGNGINAALNDFWAMWDSIADGSELAPTREEMVSIAEILANQVAMRNDDMEAIRKDLNSRIDSAVKDINSIIASIASLNQEIMAREDPSRNQQANDLRDTRDSLMIQLSELIEVDYWEDPNNGAVNITFPSGPALVMNEKYYEVGTATDDSGDIRVIANYRRTQPPWPEDVTERISGSGAVGGWIEFRDVKMREFFLQYESFVDNLMFQVNNQHAQGVGQDLYTTNTGTSLVSNHPSQVFSFAGNNNDIKLSALVPHTAANEPYSPMNDPDNIAVRFTKAPSGSTKEITSSVVWNDKDPSGGKWEVTIVLPTDSNGNVTATAEDVIRHINTEKTPTPSSGVPTLPPQSLAWPYKVGDFISAESAAGNNWNGVINFPGASYPTGKDQFTSLDRSLANATNQGHHLSYGSEYAKLDTSFKHTNNDLTFYAKQSGAAGESIAIEYANNGANQTLGVNVFKDINGTTRISVNLATDADGNVTTTALEIEKLINSNAATRDLVKAQSHDDGLGIVKEMDAKHLDRSGYFEIVTYTPYDDDAAEPTIYRVTVDPTDTLQDVAGRIGLTFDKGIPGIRAEIITDIHGNDVLRIVADTDEGIEYGFREDTSGALAVLGINNIFTGDSAANIGVSQALIDNPGLLAAGRIADDGTFTAGDGGNALDLSNLKDKRFDFYRLSNATLGTAFNTFYADIGSTNRAITTDHDFVYSVLDEMYSKQDTLAGVNLDEELADTLRYQYMYQASAKMVSTIDSMMETLLAMR